MPARATLTVDARRRARGARASPRWVWILVPLLALTGIFFYPLFFIVKQSLTGEAGQLSVAPYAAMLSSSLFQGALLRTAEIAALSTAGCLALGFVLALIMSFVPYPGARVIG